MCDSNNMTDKTKVMINEATDLAEEQCNVQLEPVHLAVTLFGEKEIGGRMCAKVSACRALAGAMKSFDPPKKFNSFAARDQPGQPREGPAPHDGEASHSDSGT